MEYVDLGLPSGKLWAKHLLGMNSDTDIENTLYFQWGSENGYRKDGKFDFSRENCDCSKSDWNLFGDGVKLPSEDDFNELLNNTERHVETIDGVNGMRLVSKTNGNSIFIPFIGYRIGSDADGVGDDVSLWSSSLCVSSHSNAVILYADSNGSAYVYDDNRYYGHGVLGIKDKDNNMETEKTLKITAPDGYEIDKKKSTFENIVFKKKENSLPQSWEEFIDENRTKISCYISSNGHICNYFHCKFSSPNEFETVEDAEEMIAFMKLRHLRDVYRQGWKPDWENNDIKYIIKVVGNFVDTIFVNRYSTAFLSFQTKEICEEFASNFEDLILKAKNLIG